MKAPNHTYSKKMLVRDSHCIQAKEQTMKQIYTGTRKIYGTMTMMPYLFATTRACLFIIAIMVISISFISNARAIEFSFTSPPSAEVDEEFDVTIAAETQD